MSNVGLVKNYYIMDYDTGEFFNMGSTLKSLTYCDEDIGGFNATLTNVFVNGIDDYSISVTSDYGFTNIDIEDIIGFES